MTPYASAAELLRDLVERGVTVRRDGDELVLSGPVAAEQIEAARRLKPDLLRLITPAAITPEYLAEGWRGAVREWGALAAYPRVTYKPGHGIAPGALAWGKWTARASVPDLMYAADALRAHLDTLPQPEATS